MHLKKACVHNFSPLCLSLRLRVSTTMMFLALEVDHSRQQLGWRAYRPDNSCIQQPDRDWSEVKRIMTICWSHTKYLPGKLCKGQPFSTGCKSDGSKYYKSIVLIWACRGWYRRQLLISSCRTWALFPHPVSIPLFDQAPAPIGADDLGRPCLDHFQIDLSSWLKRDLNSQRLFDTCWISWVEINLSGEGATIS
jgi:hypothetical protein